MPKNPTFATRFRIKGEESKVKSQKKKRSTKPACRKAGVGLTNQTK
jgi:hypothetical protein